MKLFAAPISASDKNAEHETAYALLTYAVQDTYHIPLPNIARDSRGKPFFPDVPSICFNLSHCHGLAVCGISDSALGVDVEQIRPLRSGVLRRSFSPEEIHAVQVSSSPDERFFRLWTLKESYVKAIGVGISFPLHTAAFSLCNGTIHTSLSGWQFGQFLLGDKWVVSYCIAEADAPPDHVSMIRIPAVEPYPAIKHT